MTEPNRKITDLAMRLSVSDTCGPVIDQIVKAYRKTGSIAETASHLGVGKRTLERWIRKTPELNRRIEEVRADMYPPR